MKTGSLRFRLLVSAFVSISAALAASGFGLQALFGHHVERQLDVQLESFLGELIGRIEPSEQGDIRLTQGLSDPRFEQPHSGLYWQIQEDTHHELLRSRSLWDTLLRLPEDQLELGVVHRHSLAGPGGQSLLVREQQVLAFPETSPRRLRVAVAIDRSDLLKAREAFSRDMFPYLFLLGIALLIATWLQILTGLSPLQHIRRGVLAVQSGEVKRLATDFPAEVQPLIGEINNLLDSRDKAIEDARAWTADLAHGLKTPLAALGADAQRLRSQGFEDMADDLDALAQSMRQRVDRELIRARLRSRVSGPPQSADPKQLVEGLINTIRRIPEAKGVDWQVAIPTDARVAIPPPDLTELLGNLLDNAAKWSRERVRVCAEFGDRCRIRIEDDGPGVPSEQLLALGQRGVRLDQQVSGTGLGLAIARDIIEAYQGELLLGRSDLGGLKVELFLPPSSPDIRKED